METCEPTHPLHLPDPTHSRPDEKEAGNMHVKPVSLRP